MDQVWFDLRRAAFDLQEDDSLSQIIMASTLNIIQNQGSKNKGLMESVLMKIHDATVGDPDVACPFTAPAFHLSFKVSFALESRILYRHGNLIRTLIVFTMRVRNRLPMSVLENCTISLEFRIA